MTGFQHFAEALVFAHGTGAAAEAAKHARLAERIGDFSLAETWRDLESAVVERRFQPLNS